MIARSQLIQSVNKFLLMSYQTVEFTEEVLGQITERTLQYLNFTKSNIIDILMFSQTLLLFHNNQVYLNIIDKSDFNVQNAERVVT